MPAANGASARPSVNAFLMNTIPSLWVFKSFSARWRAVFSKQDLAIIFVVVLGALGVALYFGWIAPIEALVALVILAVAAMGVSLFTQ